MHDNLNTDPIEHNSSSEVSRPSRIRKYDTLDRRSRGHSTLPHAYRKLYELFFKNGHNQQQHYHQRLDREKDVLVRNPSPSPPRIPANHSRKSPDTFNGEFVNHMRVVLPEDEDPPKRCSPRPTSPLDVEIEFSVPEKTSPSSPCEKKNIPSPKASCTSPPIEFSTQQLEPEKVSPPPMPSPKKWTVTSV